MAGAPDLIVPAGVDSTIDLGAAIDGDWMDAPSATGVYDADEWAVVFKYNSIDIAGTVRFTNHPNNPPVVWICETDAIIRSGAVVGLDGAHADRNQVSITRPGPGGFSGGRRDLGSPSQTGSGGRGMGGGNDTSDAERYGRYAIYRAYGNSGIMPLIGGSGGTGGDGGSDKVGGAGGGALLLFSRGLITLNGEITANGGNGYGYTGDWERCDGSGGGIRLIAESVIGTGFLDVRGGNSTTGTHGRSRVECFEVSLTRNQGDFGDYHPKVLVDSDPLVFPEPDAMPTLTFTGVYKDTDFLADPDLLARLRDPEADWTSPQSVEVAINAQDSVKVELTLFNPDARPVESMYVKVVQKSGGVYQVDAIIDSGENATDPTSRWTAKILTDPGGTARFYAMQARAVFGDTP